MTRIVIKYLIWDSFNNEHVEKHGLTKEIVEKAIKQIKYHKHSYKKRYFVVCEIEGKFIALVVSRKLLNTYYVISARVADKKERKLE